MTKNSDVSWIPKPVGCSLKRFTTDELVAELKGRHELCPVVDEMTREPEFCPWDGTYEADWFAMRVIP